MHVQVEVAGQVRRRSRTRSRTTIGSVEYPRRGARRASSPSSPRIDGPDDPRSDLGAPSGHDIELGGEFAFWARAA